MKSNLFRNKQLAAIVFCLLVLLNIFDLICTLMEVRAEVATEANPVMDFFLQKGECWFILAKMLLFNSGLFYLWVKREFMFSVVAVMLTLLLYISVTVIHIKGIELLVS